MMGGYTDKLSYEERWQVIHYIRSLQAKNYKLEYNEEINTLNKGALPLVAWKAAYKSSHGEMMSERHHAEDHEGEALDAGHDDHGHDDHGDDHHH